MRLLKYVWIVLAALALPVKVSAQVQDCDRLAASPLDPQKQSPGLGFSQLNASLAPPTTTSGSYTETARGFKRT